MSPFGRSLAFLPIYVVYLLVGGYIFNAIECPQEITIKKADFNSECKIWVSYYEAVVGQYKTTYSVNVFIHDAKAEKVVIIRNLYKYDNSW